MSTALQSWCVRWCYKKDTKDAFENTVQLWGCDTYKYDEKYCPGCKHYEHLQSNQQLKKKNKQRTHTVCNKAITGPCIDSISKLYSSSTSPHLQATMSYGFYIDLATSRKHQPDKPSFDEQNDIKTSDTHTHHTCATCIYSCMTITCDTCFFFWSTRRKANLREYAVNEWFKK